MFKNFNEIILYVHNLLTTNNIDFILDCGNLLKFYRDDPNNVDETDDFDFAINEKDIDKVKTLILNDEKLKDFLKVKKEWKTELSVFIKGFQVDFYSYGFDDKKVYHYFYTKNPNDNMQWTLGYRVAFDKDIYFPLQTRTYLGVDWKCPNDIEKKLTIHYGEWKKPINQFYGSHNIPGVDPHYLSDEKDYVPVQKLSDQIAIVLTTFMRDDMIMQTLKHYLKYPYRIYLADQGFYSIEKEDFYDTLRSKGHVIVYCPFDSGLSYCRNKIISLVKEPYLFLTDDDILIRSGLERYLKHFKNQHLGIVGGQLYNHSNGQKQIYTNNLELTNGVLSYHKVNEGFCDIVLNFFLARTEVFKDVQYDINLKLTEHSDFFLTLKKSNKWKVYYDSSLVGDHYPTRPEEYKEMRSRPMFYEMFKQKWSITSVKGIN